MSKHTSGPWAAFGIVVRSSPVVLEGKLVAETTDWPMGSKELAESYANARLIAAAPELLDALRLCIAQLKADEPDFGLEGDAIYAAEMAIAKVEGQKE